MSDLIYTEDDLRGYYDDNGNFIVCEEPGSDADFDRYATEIMNNDGYYDSTGHFIRYKDE